MKRLFVGNTTAMSRLFLSSLVALSLITVPERIQCQNSKDVLMCGTQMPAKLRIPQETDAIYNTRVISDSCTSIVRIKCWVGRDNYGNSSWDDSIIPDLISFTNAIYENANIEFVITDIEYIDSDYFNNWTNTMEPGLTLNALNDNDVLNLYFFQNVSILNDAVGGYTQFAHPQGAAFVKQYLSTYAERWYHTKSVICLACTTLMGLIMMAVGH